MRPYRCFAAAVLVAIVAPVVAGSAAATTPDEPAGEARHWDLLDGWVPLLQQPATAPQERWTSDALQGFDGHFSAFVDTTFVGIEEAPGGLVVTGVDLQTGERLWTTDIDVTDDSTGTALVTPMYEIGEGAIGIQARREDFLDPTGDTSPQDSSGVADDAADDGPVDKIVFDVATGDVAWRGVEGEECCIDVAVTDELVVVDGTAIDRQTGDWVWHSEGDLDTSGSHLLVESRWDAEEQGFGVVDPASGELAWWEPINSPEPVDDETYVAADTVIRIDDGEEPVIEGYDLLTGTQRWTTPLDEIDVELTGSANVTALGDNLAMITDFDPPVPLPWDRQQSQTGGAAVLDLLTGRVAWQVDAETSVGYAIDGGGQPIVIRRHESGYTVLDGATGDELAELPCQYTDSFDRFAVVSGAALCVTTDGDADETHRGQTVTLIDLDNGDELWRVELPAGEFFFLTIDGGFVTTRVTGEGEERSIELVGYGA